MKITTTGINDRTDIEWDQTFEFVDELQLCRKFKLRHDHRCSGNENRQDDEPENDSGLF